MMGAAKTIEEIPADPSPTPSRVHDTVRVMPRPRACSPRVPAATTEQTGCHQAVSASTRPVIPPRSAMCLRSYPGDDRLSTHQVQARIVSKAGIVPCTLGMAAPMWVIHHKEPKRSRGADVRAVQGSAVRRRRRKSAAVIRGLSHSAECAWTPGVSSPLTAATAAIRPGPAGAYHHVAP